MSSRAKHLQAFNRRIGYLSVRIEAARSDGRVLSYDVQELEALRWFRDQYIALSDEVELLRKDAAAV